MRDFSPTQLDAAEQCPTLWWMQWPQQHRQPQSPAQAFGEECHAQVLGQRMPTGIVGGWVVNNIMPTFSQALAVLPYLAHQPEYAVEREFKYGGMVCRTDYIDIDPDTGILRVTDLKFTSSWHLFEKTDEELLRNAQALVNVLFLTDGRADLACTFRWIICHKKTSTVRPRQVTFAPGQALTLYEEHFTPLERDMRRWQQTTDPMQLPRKGSIPDEKGKRRCQQHYGGACPMIAYCLAWGADVYGPVSNLVRRAKQEAPAPVSGQSPAQAILGT